MHRNTCARKGNDLRRQVVVEQHKRPLGRLRQCKPPCNECARRNFYLWGAPTAI